MDSYKLFDSSTLTLDKWIESFKFMLVFGGMFFLVAFLLYFGDKNKKLVARAYLRVRSMELIKATNIYIISRRVQL